MAKNIKLNGACWEWCGYRDSNGYGVLTVALVGVTNYKPIRAHRLMHYLITGEQPVVVRHTCDNPCCINPAHLVSGTHADNSNDMRCRGRARGGRITQEQANVIREQTNISAQAFADAIGVSVEWIHKIRRHEAYKMRL